jgi:hypothetical protein
MWLNPIEVVLATWLLARQTGAGCVGPIISALRKYNESFYLGYILTSPSYYGDHEPGSEENGASGQSLECRNPEASCNHFKRRREYQGDQDARACSRLSKADTVSATV